MCPVLSILNYNRHVSSQSGNRVGPLQWTFWQTESTWRTLNRWPPLQTPISNTDLIIQWNSSAGCLKTDLEEINKSLDLEPKDILHNIYTGGVTESKWTRFFQITQVKKLYITGHILNTFITIVHFQTWWLWFSYLLLWFSRAVNICTVWTTTRIRLRWCMPRLTKFLWVIF